MIFWLGIILTVGMLFLFIETHSSSSSYTLFSSDSFYSSSSSFNMKISEHENQQYETEKQGWIKEWMQNENENKNKIMIVTVQNGYQINNDIEDFINNLIKWSYHSRPVSLMIIYEQMSSLVDLQLIQKQYKLQLDIKLVPKAYNNSYEEIYVYIYEKENEKEKMDILYMDMNARFLCPIQMVSERCRQYCQDRMGFLNVDDLSISCPFFYYIGSFQCLTLLLAYLHDLHDNNNLCNMFDASSSGWWITLPSVFHAQLIQNHRGVFCPRTNVRAQEHTISTDKKPSTFLMIHHKQFDTSNTMLPRTIPWCLLGQNQKKMLDVLLLVHPKDHVTVKKCIEMLCKNILELRRIYVVTKFPHAFGDIQNSTIEIVILDENDKKQTGMPFQFDDVQQIIKDSKRAGWYFQQLVKLHADHLPDSLPCILSVDSDTLVTQRLVFLTHDSKTLFGMHKDHFAKVEPVYMEHMKRCLPEGFYDRMNCNQSGIAHHMLFHASKLNELRTCIERKNQDQNIKNIKSAWHLILEAVNPVYHSGSGMSEFEMYFHFMRIYYPHECDVRSLNHKEIASKSDYDFYLEHPHLCDLLSAHQWARNF